MTKYFSEIKKITPTDFIEMNLDLNFASITGNHRQLIRNNITHKYQSHLLNDEIEKIENLNLLPKSEKLFFSISHHQNLGGYTVCDIPHGFDIELKSRISEQIVKRVSTPLEISKTPDIQFLWCAKESAFKALNNTNLIISDICTTDWSSQIKTGLWSYRINSDKPLDLNRNIGFVFHDEAQIYSIFFK